MRVRFKKQNSAINIEIRIIKYVFIILVIKNKFNYKSIK